MLGQRVVESCVCRRIGIYPEMSRVIGALGAQSEPFLLVEIDQVPVAEVADYIVHARRRYQACAGRVTTVARMRESNMSDDMSLELCGIDVLEQPLPNWQSAIAEAERTSCGSNHVTPMYQHVAFHRRCDEMGLEMFGPHLGAVHPDVTSEAEIR